jgi:hypothetical protein
MYWHTKNQVQINSNYTVCEYCTLIRKLGYANPCLETTCHVMPCELATTCFGCQCFCHVVSEQTELLLLITRLPLHCLVTHKEHFLTQLPILVKDTIGKVRSLSFKIFPLLAAGSKEWGVLSVLTVLAVYSILSHTIPSFATGFQFLGSIIIILSASLGVCTWLGLCSGAAKQVFTCTVHISVCFITCAHCSCTAENIIFGCGTEQSMLY